MNEHDEFPTIPEFIDIKPVTSIGPPAEQLPGAMGPVSFSINFLPDAPRVLVAGRRNRFTLPQTNGALIVEFMLAEDFVIPDECDFTVSASRGRLSIRVDTASGSRQLTLEERE